MANFDQYEKAGKKYHRATTVIDYFQNPGLVDWKVKKGKREAGIISRKALKDGSRIDELCEKDWMDGKYRLRKSDSYEVVSGMRAWEMWKKEYPDVFEDIQGMQETVYYDDWGCAGTLDIRTSRAIIDLKSSKYLSKSYWIQLAFYNRQYQLPERWVLNLSKDACDYRFVKCPEKYSQAYLENLFVGRLVNYNFEREGEFDE